MNQIKNQYRSLILNILNIRTKTRTMEKYLINKNMDSEPIIIQTEIFMKDSGEAILKLERENFITKMENFILEHGDKMIKMDKECNFIIMEIDM